VYISPRILENSFKKSSPLISFNGIAITGFAPDSFVRLRRNSDLLGETVGAAGELSLTKIADRTGEIEIELMQTSQSNLLLSSVSILTENGGPVTVGVLMIQDPSGSVLATALNAYIKSLPEVELGAEQNSKTWTFGCEILQYTSTPPGSSAGYKGFTL